ncbi:hypothetical protein COE25_09570 [Bacillus sp. AFS031507]|nr:hypothetical protein COE25_09570 [Bacillus sp. AFS031507]
MKLDFAINYMPIYSFYVTTGGFLSQVIIFPIMENQHLLGDGSLPGTTFKLPFLTTNHVQIYYLRKNFKPRPPLTTLFWV